MMPHIDFSAIEEAQEFVPVPRGTYRAKAVDVEESETRHGDDMWTVQFEILAGEHEGRTVFDRFVFAGKALGRVKRALKRLGVDADGAMDVGPNDILERTCLLSVEESEYEDSEGRIKLTNKVPWAGYDYDRGADAEGENGDSAPF